MKEFELPLSKDYQRPIIKINKLDAIIDTGAMIPTFSIPAPLVEQSFNAKKILSNSHVTGFGGKSYGDVYEIDSFKVGELEFKPFQFFVPNQLVTKHPFLLSASMFYGTDYDFNTIDNKFIVRVEKEEDLTRSFLLKDLEGKLYAQINDILLQETSFEPLEEVDNLFYDFGIDEYEDDGFDITDN